MVRSLSKYLGPQKGDVFEYNAEMKIDGKSIVIEQNIVGWEKGDMSKSFFFNLVPNKGTLVSPVSYAFSPQEIYEALKDKYNK